MRTLLSLFAIGLALSAGCLAQHCPDPNAQRATVGGDTIDGSVSLQQKPMTSVQVRLLSKGKTIWTGLTDSVGSFHIKNVRPGTYRLACKEMGDCNRPN